MPVFLSGLFCYRRLIYNGFIKRQCLKAVPAFSGYPWHPVCDLACPDDGRAQSVDPAVYGADRLGSGDCTFYYPQLCNVFPVSAAECILDLLFSVNLKA